MSILGGHGVGAHGAEEDEVFLNLTPMIDILTCLLFFLLLSFGAVIIALVNASVPVISDSDTGDPNVSQDKLTMGLAITDKGMLLTASHDKLSEATLAGLKKFFQKKGKEQDFTGLHEYLWDIKRRYPRSTSIVITPIPSIMYSDLVSAMDASRERPIVKDKKPYRIPMFPEAVISTLVE
jgi:biopolymer transport protein ExbD